MEFITKTEREGLEGRLAALIANRKVLSARIAAARELGDLKENGDYHAAREQQGMEEAEIRRLEDRLAKSSVVEEGGKNTGIVFLGATVKLLEQGEDEPELFKLVGEASSDAGEVVEVTVGSPMGEALLKARVGETIAVRGPRGTKKFKIVEIV